MITDPFCSQTAGKAIQGASAASTSNLLSVSCRARSHSSAQSNSLAISGLMIASEQGTREAANSSPSSGDETPLLRSLPPFDASPAPSPAGAPPLKRQCTSSQPTCAPSATTHGPFMEADQVATTAAASMSSAFARAPPPASFLAHVPELATGTPTPQLFSSTPAEHAAPAAPPAAAPAATTARATAPAAANTTDTAAPATSRPAPLEHLISTFGDRVDQVPPQEAGALGQVILVASRLGAYCRAAWQLVLAAGETPAGDGSEASTAAEGGAPLARYCDVLKLLMRHSILQRVQALHATATRSSADARALLQHVLLWQYLKHRNVMDLMAISFERHAAAAPSADGSCFLTTLGVELIRGAMQQAKGTVQVPQVTTTADGSEVERCGPLQDVDMARALAAVYDAAQLHCPSSSDDAVASLTGDEGALHRVTAFLARHHVLVTQVLAGIDHTPAELHSLYLALAHASTLLMPLPQAPCTPPSSGAGSGSGSNNPCGTSAAASVVVVDTPAVTAARAAVARYNASIAACQRAAKAAILDARIEAARNSRWNAAVSACSVKAAVAKAFREAYLWPELKQLLNTWGPIVDRVVDSEELPPAASIGACAAASATFDASPLGIRFRVPSAGFMLVWATAPTSPAHLIGRRGEFGALFGSGPATAASAEPARSAAGVPVPGHGSGRTVTRVVQSCAAMDRLGGGGGHSKGTRRRRTDSCPTVHEIIRDGSSGFASSGFCG